MIYVGGDPRISQEESEPGVEYNMADRFEMNLGILSNLDPNRPILITMASCGGNWDEGMQMFGAILHAPNPITVMATKWARSMTSIIPLAADRFVIRPPAKYMYHRGTYEFSGIDQEVETEDYERRKMNETMRRIYIARLKEQGAFKDRSETEIRNILEDSIKENIDVWLSADEAKRWGFVDDVFDGNMATLRAEKKNINRRAHMISVIRKPIKITVTVS